MPKIEPLEIDLLKMTDKEFAEKKAEFIKDYTQNGHSYDFAKAKFEQKYPDKETWCSENIKLSGYGQQNLINKVNEIVSFINELTPSDVSNLKDELKELL